MSDRSVNIQELTDHKLLWGDLLWVKKSGHSTRVGSCGDFVDLEFVEKLVSKNATLEMSSFIDWKLVKELNELFDELKNAENEAQRVKLRSEFCNKFFPVFLGSEEGSYIDWFTVCFRSFYELPKDIEDIFYMKNSDALKRSMAVASMTTLLSFTLGYMNFDFLKKVYNSTLIMDISFVNKGMSEFHLRDLEEQREKETPVLDGQLLKHFKHHGNEVSLYLEKVTNGEMIFKKMIEYHHEIFNNGKGPENIFDSETGDLPQAISFIERFIPYTGFDLKKGDATSALTSFLGKVDGYNRIKSILRTEVGRVA